MWRLFVDTFLSVISPWRKCVSFPEALNFACVLSVQGFITLGAAFGYVENQIFLVSDNAVV